MSTARRTLTDQEAELAIRIIKAKVATFLGPPRRPRERWLESRDLEQDALARLVAAIECYDPSCASLATFIARVTDGALKDYLRWAYAEKRNPGRRPVSLAQDIADSGASHERSIDLGMDLRDHVESLPEQLRLLLEQLRNSTVPEIAKRDGVHRGTIDRRLGQVRKQWETGSLRDYLDD
jgi:RNA polymerase sigma factor (sigma-70 family)